MRYWANLTDKLKTHLLKGEKGKVGNVLNFNFNRRRKLYSISAENLQMVDQARFVGASAKFTGSGGAIVGTYKDATMFKALKKRLGKLKIKVIKPVVALPNMNGVI